MLNEIPNPLSLGLFQPQGSRQRTYLDYNATSPPSLFLKEKMVEWLEHWGNPSSIHWNGRGPKALLRQARQAAARFLNCDPLEIIFTSGGSESNNLAIQGVYQTWEKQSGSHQYRKQYLFSSVEHPSVTKTMRALEALGARVDLIPVSRHGQIDLEAYAELLSDQTALVSVMYANNETGTIFPITKMAKMAHKVGALFHCDGVQALGKTIVDVRNWQVDLASFSGHKFYALKGCGILYVRRGLSLTSLIHGGGQERGRRAGTENILSIASLGEIFTRAHDVPLALQHMTNLRDSLEKKMLARIPGVSITGFESHRLPNTTSAILENIDGETLLMNLDMGGFSVSTGAACSSGNPEPSPVLLAMGLSYREAQSSLRVSLGWGTTQDEIDRFVDFLVPTVARLRGFHHAHQQKEHQQEGPCQL